jgi:hypothetical protein
VGSACPTEFLPSRVAGEGVQTGGPLRSLTAAAGRPKSRHRGSGPPLVGSACPTEFLPSRVAGHRFPAPPLPFPLSRWAPGSFPVRPHRRSEEHRRPLLGLAPLQGFQPATPTGSSPSRFLPWGSSPLRRSHARGSGPPGFASPGTFRPRGSKPPRRFAPRARCRPEGRRRPWDSPYRAFLPPIGRARYRTLTLMPFLGSPCLLL